MDGCRIPLLRNDKQLNFAFEAPRTVVYAADIGKLALPLAALGRS